MFKPKSHPKRPRIGESSQRNLVKAADALSEFEEFQREVLPMLRADLRKGLTAKELRKKYMALLEARKLSIALGSLEEGVAVSAIKDVQDREEGRATEKKVVTHKYEDLPEEELDAILRSEADDLADQVN